MKLTGNVITVKKKTVPNVPNVNGKFYTKETFDKMVEGASENMKSGLLYATYDISLDPKKCRTITDMTTVIGCVTDIRYDSIDINLYDTDYVRRITPERLSKMVAYMHSIGEDTGTELRNLRLLYFNLGEDLL